MIEILYHTLWETVHIFFEHRELGHDVGEAGFLYPFLGKKKQETVDVVEEVARSIQMKAQDDALLRAQVAKVEAEKVGAAAVAIRERIDRGGKLIIFGNGGSATDANDWAIDCVMPPEGYEAIPAISLSMEPANISAIANDVGPELIFQRQLIAQARPGDVAIAISTRGGSKNIVVALEEARKRNLLTVGLLGYDGGEVGRPRPGGFSADRSVGLHSAHPGSAGIDLSPYMRNAPRVDPCLDWNCAEPRGVPTRRKCANGSSGKRKSLKNSTSRPIRRPVLDCAGLRNLRTRFRYWSRTAK